MGQYTCNECREIPKIISSNIGKKSILIKCKNHGQKELNLKDYIINSLKFNPSNWKCTKCENIQKRTKALFKHCECGFAYCEYGYKIHTKNENLNSIDNDKYYLYIKYPKHFGKNILAIVLIVTIIFVKHERSNIKVILKCKIVIWK